MSEVEQFERELELAVQRVRREAASISNAPLFEIVYGVVFSALGAGGTVLAIVNNDFVAFAGFFLTFLMVLYVVGSWQQVRMDLAENAYVNDVSQRLLSQAVRSMEAGENK